MHLQERNLCPDLQVLHVEQVKRASPNEDLPHVMKVKVISAFKTEESLLFYSLHVVGMLGFMDYGGSLGFLGVTRGPVTSEVSGSSTLFLIMALCGQRYLLGALVCLHCMVIPGSHSRCALLVLFNLPLIAVTWIIWRMKQICSHEKGILQYSTRA